MKKLRFICALFIAVFLLLIPGQAVQAEENNYEVYPDDIISSIDKDSADLIDEEAVEDQNFSEIGLSLVSYFISSALKVFLRNFLRLAGVILICCVISKISETVKVKHVPEILALSQVFLISAVTYSLLEGVFAQAEEYIAQTNSLMTAYGVIMSEIYLLGGNISQAAVSSAWLAFALEVSRRLCLGTLIPIIRICFSATLAASVSTSVNLRAVANFMRNMYVSVSVFFMTVLTVIMSFQSTLAGANDSIALRSVKFAASNTIPIIGGLVSESMRTLSSGVTLMKSYSGTICIICLIAVSIIPLAHVFGVKYTLSLGETFSDYIGVSTVKGFLSDCGKLINYMIGLIVITDIYFIYFVSVFIKSTGAIGG